MLRLKSIKARLLVAFVVPVCLVVLIALISFKSLSLVAEEGDTLYKGEIAPLQILKRISDNYAVHVIDSVNKANAGILSADEARTELTKAQRAIASDWQFYQQGALNTQEQLLSRRAEVLFQQADQAIVAASDRLERHHGSVTGLLSDFEAPLYRSIDPITALIDELVQVQLDRAKKHYLHSNQQYDRLIYWVLVMAGLAIVISLYTTLRVAGNLNEPTEQDKYNRR